MKQVIAVLFIPLIYFYGVNLLQLFQVINITNTIQLNFIGGFIGGIVFIRLFLRKISFFRTFEHELTHNIWAILTLNKPTGFHVEKDNGGYFSYSGRSNFLITLSPYFFHTLNLFLLLITIFIQDKFYPLFAILIGVATAYHFVSDIHEARPHQTDIQKNGLFFSYVTILLGNIIMYGLIISFIIGSWNNMALYFTKGGKDMYIFFVELFKTIF